MSPPRNLIVRPARPADLPAIHAIQTHYIRHTVVNFAYMAPSLDALRADYDAVLAAGYPYLVAVPAAPDRGGGGGAPALDPSKSTTVGPGAPTAQAAAAFAAISTFAADAPALASGPTPGHPRPVRDASAGVETGVRGFAYVHAYRARAAYQYTGELSIFCAVGATGQGVGGALLEAVIGELKESSRRARAARGKGVERSEEEGEAEGVDADEKAWGRPRDVHQLMACMTVNPDEETAEGLKRFYERRGFVEIGRLKKVGWKFGRWLDTRYMQLELQE